MDRRTRRHLKVHLEEQLDKTIASRPCGECTACCEALHILELNKPEGVLCAHATLLRGCGIYPDRPKPCREYLCLWKAGVGTPEQRPDRLGVVLSPTAPGAPGYPGVLVHELWPDAFGDAREFLLDTARAVVLLLMRDGIPKTVLGPPEVVRGMKTQMAEIKRLNEDAKRARESVSLEPP